MRFTRILALVTVPLVALQTAQAQAPTAAVAPAAREYAGAIATARRFIRDTMQALGAPGASITVMKQGRVIWSEGFGFADLEQQVPATPLTKFRIGSISKALTSVALGQLVQDGKLDLDAPVQKYAPGIRHYDRAEEDFSYTHFTDVLASLEIFRDDSLRFEPGTRFGYSSYGWNLLSAVIEGAGRERYLTLMQRYVFDRAEMRHTVADYVDSIIPNRARWYTRATGRGGIINAGFTDNSYKWAGGGFLSTTEDLAEFADALTKGRLLSPETVKLLWTSQKTRDGKDTEYGIGWSTDVDSAGRRRISHGGGSVGGTAYLIIYPDQDLIVAVLVNSDSTFVGATPTIAEMFLR